MKIFLIAFAFVAAVAADVSHLPTNEYLPPVQSPPAVAAPTNEYLPPVQQVAPVQQHTVVEAAPAHELADDGYRYKTHRRVVYRRNRRDVSHLPTNEYLPPVEESAPIVESAPVEQVAYSAQEAVPAHELADDGYRYKTHRRVVYRRNRRDVSHLPSNEYLPPVQQQESAPVAAPTSEYLPPVQQHTVVEAAPAHELADDGYRYKTQRRVVVRRNRRDVSHLPSNEYLPPVQQQESAPVAAPTSEYLPPVQQHTVVEAAPAHELADDGYRYKTQRRVLYRRNRRDVSHLPSNEYLPPVQQQESAPVQEVQQVAYAVEEAAPAHELADDGYRYKTHRRVVVRRNRRDVSHLPSNEYLPPGQEAQSYAPVEEVPVVVNVVEEAAPAHDLADDGYRYKTHRRVVYRRNRRDVSHLPSNEYLPPVQQAAPVAAPSNDYLPPVQQPAPVHHVAPAQYVAPVQQQAVSYSVPEAAPAHELAADGYRYKTQRRVVYRRH